MDADAGPAACRPHLATRAVHMDELLQIGVESITRVDPTPARQEQPVAFQGDRVEARVPSASATAMGADEPA